MDFKRKIVKQPPKKKGKFFEKGGKEEFFKKGEIGESV